MPRYHIERTRVGRYEYQVVNQRCAAVGVESALRPTPPTGDKGWVLFSVVVCGGQEVFQYWRRPASRPRKAVRTKAR